MRPAILTEHREVPLQLPKIPDDDADFTPDLARKIVAQYQELLRKKVQEISLLESQFSNCHIEIGKLRDALMMAGVSRS
jgi:hypothetical protein